MTPESAKELESISPTFQQFLIRYLDLRDSIILTDLKKEMKKIYLEDNKSLCKNVTDAVSQNLAETLAPLWNKLGEIDDRLANIEEGQNDIAGDISTMKGDISNIRDRLGVVEDKVETDEERIGAIEKRLDCKKQRIEEIEDKIALLQPDLIKDFIKKIAGLEPQLTKIVRYNSLSVIILRIAIGVFVGIGLMIALLKWIWHVI